MIGCRIGFSNRTMVDRSACVFVPLEEEDSSFELDRNDFENGKAILFVP